MLDPQALRQQIEGHLARERWAQAREALTSLWRAQPTPAAANFVAARFERLRGRTPFAPCRLAVLRSFTVEPLVPLLRAGAFAGGIDLSVQVGEFNAYAQEILNSESKLYRFAPDVVILAAQTRDLAPELWDSFTALSSDEVQAVVERVTTGLRDLIRAFRRRSQAHLIVHGLETPLFPARGVLDAQTECSQAAAVNQINRAWRRLAVEERGVYFLDYDAVVARHGRARWHDERRRLTTRLPFTVDAFAEMTGEWLRFLHPLAGRVCKALITDLDNTLWGGVVGEDGIEGVKLGTEHPGAHYQALQRVMLDLYRRGVILGVCSKNNLADALAALESHPGMILRPEHFAALRINWQDKAQNLRELAAELNIGPDSIAFVDDNPAECARVRQELPEVTVIELPADPAQFAATLRGCAVFERLTLSAEDRERGRYYAEQRRRQELQTGAASLEDFYRSLAQEVEIAPVTPLTLARVAQLTQKTNQFNLTTRRYSEQQVAAMAADPRRRVYAARVKDRFGDHGLVGVMILDAASDRREIDTFLLSCRVIGRTVETALLAFLVDEARAAGARTLQGRFLPTKKNAPAQSFYADHRFQVVAQQDGGTLWALDLAQTRLACPDWIQLHIAEGATAS
jgi:FkbH-like protein